MSSNLFSTFELTCLLFFISRADILKPFLTAGHWISPGINPFANITSVFFTAMQADIGEEDVVQSSEMSVYMRLIPGVFLTESSFSDKKEELKIFDDIIRLVPSFKDVVMACSEHRQALLNLIQMVSFFSLSTILLNSRLSVS